MNNKNYYRQISIVFVTLLVITTASFLSNFKFFNNIKLAAAVYDAEADVAIASGWETLPNSFAWGEGTGWINFTSTTTNRIYIANNALWGYAYGSSIGWISLNCNNEATCPYPYKIANDGQGHLSGYAWGENIGWIDFGTSTNITGRTWGVSIDSNGIFQGNAYSENAGWISFNTVNNSVTTNWRFVPTISHHHTIPIIPTETEEIIEISTSSTSPPISTSTIAIQTPTTTETSTKSKNIFLPTNTIPKNITVTPKKIINTPATTTDFEISTNTDPLITEIATTETKIGTQTERPAKTTSNYIIYIFLLIIIVIIITIYLIRKK